MQARASVGDGFRVSVASTPSTISNGGSEHDDAESQQGDIYVWGEVLSDSANGNCSKIDVLVPKLLESNLVLDIHHITSGVNHIVIVTKKGELFTWGEEFGGKLDHRIDREYSGRLRLIESLEVPNSFVHATCGEYHMCAISYSNDFFTWGDATYSASLLGHGCDTSHLMWKRIEGPLEGLQVVSISCGTWHSALTTADGKLFTFGEGAFGVLGHGDQESVMYPKEVQLLSGLKAIKVACGVWHTAAIIEVMYQSGGSNVSPWKLFTWGDGDKHRLGHGNNETYLQPTRVASLIEYNFHQVACGHTMTVALTTSGHVFTMGDTKFGQLGNPVSAGKVPTLVQDKLLGEFVEEISCGANHVAALTSKNELYTWGKGANGRLGHGDLEDKKSPTLVLALKDRHVKNISCGSKFTSCICIHKLVPVSDQTVCSGCRQAFGFMTKKHNCNNCGLAFCHPCSSKKAVNAALASTPEKPHRVCDNCYAKLIKVLEASNSSSNSNSSNASRFSRKVTPPHHPEGREVLDHGVSRSTTSRTLLCPRTKPMNYLEIKNSKSGSSYGSTSIVRASQVPSLIQLKDIEFPSSLSAFQSALKPLIPQTTALQTLSSNSNSRPTSPITRRLSPRSVSPRFSGNYVDTLRKTSERLNQEISKLQNQVQSLKLRNDTLEMENQRLQKNATEASALAAVEFSHLLTAKEFIESTENQLKKMSEKFTEETQDSEILRTIQTQAGDILREISESETNCSPPKLDSEQNTSRLQQQLVEENAAIASVDPSKSEESVLQESNESKLDSEEEKQHNEPIIIPENNVDAAQIDQLQQEISNGSKLEAEHQNSLEENAENTIQENNGSNLELPDNNETTPSSTVSPKPQEQERINEDAKNHVGAGNSNNALQESKGKSVSNNGATIMAQKSMEYGSRSLESSRSGKHGETQVIEQFEPGVFVTLVLMPDGTRVFKRVRFSKRKFIKSEAEEWWSQNKIRVLRQYFQTQKQTQGSSNISSPPHANEHIETSSSSTTSP